MKNRRGTPPVPDYPELMREYSRLGIATPALPPANLEFPRKSRRFPFDFSLTIPREVESSDFFDTLSVETTHDDVPHEKSESRAKSRKHPVREWKRLAVAAYWTFQVIDLGIEGWRLARKSSRRP